MKRDEVRRIFPDATDEQVDAVLNGIAAELNPLKSSVSDLTGRLSTAEGALSASQASEAGLKGQVADLTARVQAGMSAEELLAERERAAAQREREFLLKSNELDAKAIFVQAGFSDEDMADLLPRVVSEDGDATRAAAASLVAFDKRRREGAEKSARAAMLGENPRIGGAAGGGMTRESFDRLSFEEQMKAVADNPGLLKTLENL